MDVVSNYEVNYAWTRCEFCRKEFPYDARRWRREPPRFCSENCRSKMWNERVKGWSSRRLCPVCNTLFVPYRPNHKFCSKACQDKGPIKRARLVYKCPVCDTRFVPRRVDQKYCCRRHVEIGRNFMAPALFNPDTNMHEGFCAGPACAKPFASTNPRTRFCSDTCRRLATRAIAELWCTSPPALRHELSALRMFKRISQFYP